MAAADTYLEPELEQTGKPAGPCVMVLFGAAGDLTMRKLAPALYNLAKARLLPANFAVVGVSHDDLTLEQFREQLTRFLPAEERASEACQWFVERIS